MKPSRQRLFGCCRRTRSYRCWRRLMMRATMAKAQIPWQMSGYIGSLFVIFFLIEIATRNIYVFLSPCFQSNKETQEEPKEGKEFPLNHSSSKLKEKTSEASLTPKRESPLQALNPEDIQKESVFFLSVQDIHYMSKALWTPDHYIPMCFLNILFQI